MKHVLLTVVFLGIACVAMAHELLSPQWESETQCCA